MSWGANGRVQNSLFFVDFSNGLGTEEHLSQYEESVQSVLAVVESGALGPADAKYRVALSGHGNPGHEQTPGWANDFVQISITRVFE